MRIYKNFLGANNEIRRDLKEMGIEVTTQTMQDKECKEGFKTLELQNYIYTVLEPRKADLDPSQPWADEEFTERMSGLPINPGNAWEKRRYIWSPFLEECLPVPVFSYTYPERMCCQILMIVQELKKHPESRQLFLSVWDANKDIARLGVRRVPCSLGYYFQNREGKLNITYLQRSADLITHWQNDQYLAVKLLQWISAHAGIPHGTFTHWIGSLHVYSKDVEGVF